MLRRNHASAEVVDTSKQTEKIFKTFHDNEPHRRTKMQFGWPKEMQEVGTGKAVMYRSNKWQLDPKVFEDYKHLAESDNTVYATPGFLRDWHNPRKALESDGPMVELEQPMPRDWAVLAPLLGVQLTLEGEDPGPYEIVVAHGMLAGAKHPVTKEVMLVVYTKSAGVHMLITGAELTIEKDGVAG
jgi:hypothetical protein